MFCDCGKSVRPRIRIGCRTVHRSVEIVKAKNVNSDVSFNPGRIGFYGVKAGHYNNERSRAQGAYGIKAFRCRYIESNGITPDCCRRTGTSGINGGCYPFIMDAYCAAGTAGFWCNGNFFGTVIKISVQPDNGKIFRSRILRNCANNQSPRD